MKPEVEDERLGTFGECQRCGVPDGMWRYDPFAAEIHDDYIPILVCDDCDQEIGDDI